MKVNKSDKTEIWILNVERGLALLIKTPQDHCIIYDLGSTPEFSPVNFYKENGIIDYFSMYSDSNSTAKKIAQCIISHPHLDHISDLNKRNADFIKENSFYVTCQNDKNEGQGSNLNKLGHKIDFKRINNPDGASDEIANYKYLYEGRNLPLSTLIHNDNVLISNLKIGYYYLSHRQSSELFPYDDQKYSNSLSIVMYLSYGNNSVLIPGDITPEAFKLIIDGKCERRFTDYSLFQGETKKNKWAKETCDQPILKTLLNTGLAVLVAPHHGLESGYPEYLFEVMKDKLPKLIIISDKKHNDNTSGAIHKYYQNGKCSSGHWHKGELRYSLSTVNDGNIRITFMNNGLLIDSKKDIKKIFD